ncbi:LOW QUALITY PROTEIN: uncharacterized protein LOC27207712 [Drosophila simulans]|uniref:LOW QUALITY PROTEIN: uncharacterized protein LOC27207712 n=1 Tax=Drosophila simulans TaxID=7240 RepID=UPI00078AEBB0|nr:LOW QUALITY PROTEIN: uncharacterized protein LOC27207712 [Drosophila simulans]KMZ06586.1 LOW QUALITY PROTEIN: uncharacterized protein Dsimw501_GD27863 [Drosophila simulans]
MSKASSYRDAHSQVALYKMNPTGQCNQAISFTPLESQTNVNDFDFGSNHRRSHQMSYGFIPLNSFGQLLLLLQEEPRGSSLWKTTSTKRREGRKNHKVVLNKFKKRIGKRKAKAQNQSHS